MMQFKDRFEAGLLLLDEIQKQGRSYDMVVALPRGGVPVAKVIAENLHIPLFLMYVKKLGHPENEEFAIGAISETGLQMNESLNIEASSITHTILNARRKISEMKKNFNHEIDLKNIFKKSVLLVDDGIVTGQCMLLSIHELKKNNAQSITVATPVCPAKTLETILMNTPIVISILTPTIFTGIGMFYEDFHQMSDQEVKRILHEKGHLKRRPVNSVSNG